MKGFRSTGILTLVVAAVAGYTYWDYRKNSIDENVETNEVKLFTFKPDEVSRLYLKGAGGEAELKKEGDTWMVVKPVADQADDSAIDAILYSLSAQKGKIFRDEDDKKPIVWEEFGLNPPGFTAEVQTPKLTEKLEVSSKNAYDGSFFVRQKDVLLLGDRGLAQINGRPADSFRSKLMWRNSDVTVETADAAFDSNGTKTGFKVIHTGEKWTLDPKPAFEVDTEKVANWLVRVEQLSALEIVKDEPTQDDKRNSLLLKPSAVITLGHKAKDGKPGVWTLTVGQDRSEDIFMMTSERDTLYKGMTAAMNQIRVPVEFFRDGKRAFQFPVEEVTSIELTIKGKPYVFVKEGSEWKIRGDTTSKLNTPKLIDLIEKLSKFEAVEFVPANKVKLFKPDQRIVIRNTKDQVLLELIWGGDFKSAQPYNREQALVLAKSNLEKDGLVIQRSMVQNFIDPGLIDSKSGTTKLVDSGASDPKDKEKKGH